MLCKKKVFITSLTLLHEWHCLLILHTSPYLHHHDRSRHFLRDRSSYGCHGDGGGQAPVGGGPCASGVPVTSGASGCGETYSGGVHGDCASWSHSHGPSSLRCTDSGSSLQPAQRALRPASALDTSVGSRPRPRCTHLNTQFQLFPRQSSPDLGV